MAYSEENFKEQMGHDKGYMESISSHPGLCCPCPSLFSSAVLCYFCFPFSSLPQGSVVSVSAAPFNLLSPHPRSWHWSFSTHTGYKHSKLQIREEKKPKNKTKQKNLSDMAPKLQSKILETKAQTCPPSEAGFSAEAAAVFKGRCAR